MKTKPRAGDTFTHAHSRYTRAHTYSQAHACTHLHIYRLTFIHAPTNTLISSHVLTTTGCSLGLRFSLPDAKLLLQAA